MEPDDEQFSSLENLPVEVFKNWAFRGWSSAVAALNELCEALLNILQMPDFLLN